MENNQVKEDRGQSYKSEVKKERRPTCGIIMPISPIDGLSVQHWAEVRSIITDVAENAGFDTKIVSEADDSGMIPKRIVQNIYTNDVIICDVSAKNANVMFELGMRLAFDKATVIIKDDITGYSFDTSSIEHLEYPRDLRFSAILDFKILLEKKLMATFDNSNKEGYSMFLKAFGTFNIPNLNTSEISSERYILEKLTDIQNQMKILHVGVETGISNGYSETNHEHLIRMYSEFSNLTQERPLDNVPEFVNYVIKRHKEEGLLIPTRERILKYLYDRQG